MPGEESDTVSHVSRVLRVYWLPIVLGFVSIVCIALSVSIFIKSYQSRQPIEFSPEGFSDAADSASSSARTSEITVDIEGAVKRPGVYVLPNDSRVEDGIAKAGGLATYADLSAIARDINRAAVLSDGAKLYIPVKGEEQRAESAAGGTGGPVHVNTASQRELEALPGVGTVTAGNIISGRPYLRLEELVEKKAISQSLFVKIKDQLTL